ncbi:MAG: cysteine desulfurase [Planctomycetes bacterium]|nr:cysteine desulfurase [Planctomycetota bacterium]
MARPSTSYYLDYNATAPMLPEVQESMLQYWQSGPGNPSSLHEPGRRARAALHEARAVAAGALGAKESEVVFTSGGTESISLALQGLLGLCSRPLHVITSAIEHPATLESVRALEGPDVRTAVLPVDEFGRIAVTHVVDAVLPSTRLVTLMLANNEIGTIEPVAAVARAVASNGVLVHTDAVQAFGKMSVRVPDLDVHSLSISGHKFGGPPGTGLLYVRDGVRFQPSLRGGRQEGGRRAGTENVAGAVGLAVAMKLAVDRLDETTRCVRASTAAFLETIEEAGVEFTVNGLPPRSDGTLPNTLNLAFTGIEAQSLLVHLDLAGVAASSGSACSSGAVEPSHVLRALGLPEDRVRGSVRFSFGASIDAQAAKNAAQRVIDIVRCLRS